MRSRDILRSLLLLVLVAGVAFPQGGPATGASGAPLSAEEQNVLKADTLFSEARDLINKGKYPESSAKLQELIALKLPDDPPAHDLMAGAHAALAEVLLEQKQPQEAERVAKRGLDLTGSDEKPTRLRSELYHVLSTICASRGDESNSRTYRERAEACAKATPSK